LSDIQLMLDWTSINFESTYGPWIKTSKADQSCRKLADVHYSRITVGAKQFTRPGENLVFRTADGSAFWVTWRSKYKRKDSYGYAIECTHFHRTAACEHLSSDLIKWALYGTIQEWGELPTDGMITYVDSSKVQSKNAGYCFERAGFKRLKKRSSKGLLCYKIDQSTLELVLEEMKLIKAWEEHYLYLLNLTLNSGEFMESEIIVEEAQQDLLKLKIEYREKMKQIGINAWSEVEEPITLEELHLPLQTHTKIG